METSGIFYILHIVQFLDDSKFIFLLTPRVDASFSIRLAASVISGRAEPRTSEL
jgi:hypothetical protein